ncbi:unnamed protein product [Mycena citricolor]|uniref:Amine oxidase n=1 Tax=Mycena citricolor TaxID=2018698 RepID=A0AAD2HPL0_9AGAR|nr:unnamed protein product [Mycena citricolor]
MRGVVQLLSLASLAPLGALAGPHARLRHPTVAYTSRKSGHGPLFEVLAAQPVESEPGFSPTAAAPKANPFLSLTNDEAASIVAFLHNQTALNLTAATDAGPWDNAIEVLDLVAPNKTDALDYLDHSGPLPARYAVAKIMFGATEEPYLQDFIVGPLPISNTSTYESLDWSTTKGTSKIRNYDADSSLKSEWLYNVSTPLADILLDLFNATLDELDIWGIDPLWKEKLPITYTDKHGKEKVKNEERIVAWNTFWRYPTGENAVFDGETLLPQGLFFKADVTGRDPSQWRVLGWLYGDIFYSTTAEFRSAWEKPDFVKYEINQSGDWVGSDRVGTPFPGDTLPAPILVQPSAQRFSVDESQRYVEWMDFSFYLTFTRDTGLRLYDIRYKGERIIYELGLEEAIAHYAGNDPVQSGTAYLDTFYGFGTFAFELVPGFDCPSYAHFLNGTFHAGEVSTTHRNNICLFESDPGYLMQRHSSMNYLSLTKNIAFTVRSVSTVGNYDYNFDYIFTLDGAVETVVRASGYIQSAYYAHNSEYGYRVHDSLSGSMHDHSLNWKVDMDVLGTANTFVKHKIAPAEVKYSWSNETRKTMKLEKVKVKNEDQAKLYWPRNGADMFIVENLDPSKANKYGEARGYKISPSRGGSGMHLTIQDSPNLLKSQSFATHALYVTKQKDTEPRSAHAHNDYDPGHPIIDFSEFLDGDNLEQEDIVVWLNLGMHHVPHTGDMPNTVFTTAQSAFIISPHNYLLNDASRTTRQMVRIDYNASGVQLVKQFGANLPSGMLNLTSTNWDFTSYEGDINTRKFPYDPLHPYNDTQSIV